MYLAYDTPHAVLELPTSAYPSGFGLKGGLQWLGKQGEMINTAVGSPDSYINPLYRNTTYDNDNNSSTPEVAWPDVYKRYATVTKRIDQQVHDVLSLLEDLKIDKNTIVVFTSDNGPSIESYIKNEPYKANFFESFGPFDGIKRDVWEGGIRMPTLAYWPQHFQANLKINNPSISYDWMPTFLDVAGYKPPVRADGVSLLPELTGKSGQQKSQVYIEYVENGKTPDYAEFDPSHRSRKRGQMQMIRLGDTVAIRYNILSPDDDFEIYNIKKDPKQSHNLTKTEDLKPLEQYLKDRVLQMRLADTSAKRPYDEALIPSDSLKTSVINGWKLYQYQMKTPWVAKPTTPLNFENSSTFSLKKLAANSCLFEGYLNVPENGGYTFELNAEGKAFVRLHDIALLDEDAQYIPGTTKSVTVNLCKGYHHIKVYFKKVAGKTPDLKLCWAKAGTQTRDLSYSIYSTN
jgi:hypothetical protein